MEFHPTLIKKIFTDEPNMFANDTQTPMKIANMEFHPTLTNKLFTDENVFIVTRCKAKRIENIVN